MKTIKDLALLTLLLTLTATPLVAGQGENGPRGRESYLIQIVLLLGKLDVTVFFSDRGQQTVHTRTVLLQSQRGRPQRPVESLLRLVGLAAHQVVASKAPQNDRVIRG